MDLWTSCCTQVPCRSTVHSEDAYLLSARDSRLLWTGGRLRVYSDHYWQVPLYFITASLFTSIHIMGWHWIGELLCTSTVALQGSNKTGSLTVHSLPFDGDSTRNTRYVRAGWRFDGSLPSPHNCSLAHADTFLQQNQYTEQPSMNMAHTQSIPAEPSTPHSTLPPHDSLWHEVGWLTTTDSTPLALLIT